MNLICIGAYIYVYSRHKRQGVWKETTGKLRLASRRGGRCQLNSTSSYYWACFQGKRRRLLWSLFRRLAEAFVVFRRSCRVLLLSGVGMCLGLLSGRLGRVLGMPAADTSVSVPRHGSQVFQVASLMKNWPLSRAELTCRLDISPFLHFSSRAWSQQCRRSQCQSRTRLGARPQ